jgi:hypothetical protein
LKITRRVSEKLDHSEKVPPVDLDRLVQLIEVVVQRLHQRKEEDLLLATMEESPVDERGIFAALLSEHSLIRKYFNAMKRSDAEYRKGIETAKARFSESAKSYVIFWQSTFCQPRTIFTQGLTCTFRERLKPSLRKDSIALKEISEYANICKSFQDCERDTSNEICSIQQLLLHKDNVACENLQTHMHH